MATITSGSSLVHEEHPLVHKWGLNESVGATVETVWSGSTLYSSTPGYPSSATITKIVSGAAGDTMVATITGNDANGAEVVQTATLTGVTPVTLTTPLKRVYRVSLPTVNAGLISVTNGAGTSTYARVEVGVGQTQMCMYSVPATTKNGETVVRAEIISVGLAIRTAQACQIRLTVNGIRKDDGVYTTSGSDSRAYGSDSVVGSGLSLAVGDDVEVRAIRTGGADASVAAYLKIRLITK